MYKIIRITDNNDVDKTDEDALGRIGRVIDENQSLISPGCSGFLYCIIPGFHKSLRTTMIKRVKRDKDSMMVKTENSIYYFTKISDYK